MLLYPVETAFPTHDRRRTWADSCSIAPSSRPHVPAFSAMQRGQTAGGDADVGVKSCPFPDFPACSFRVKHVLPTTAKMHENENEQADESQGKKETSPDLQNERNQKQDAGKSGGKSLVVGGPGRKSKACKSGSVREHVGMHMANTRNRYGVQKAEDEMRSLPR